MSLRHLRQTLHTLPRDTRDTLFLLAVIGWIIVPHTAHLPLWVTGLVVVLGGWRGILAWTSRPLPQRGVLLGLLVLVVGGVFLTYRTIMGRDAGVSLIVLLLALKTLEMRARRDALVVFFLGFFAMLSHFFFSQSLPTAAAMLIALLGLLAVLVNAHLPVGRPPLMQSLRTASTMALLGAPIMLALFVFFPRLAPLWGMPSDGLTGRSGLSDSMKVGNIAQLALDDTVAFRVLFDGPNNAAPAASQLYFRGPVLSHFDGRQWQSPAWHQSDGWPHRLEAPAQLEPLGRPVRYTITLEPHQRPWLMVLDVAPEKPVITGITGMGVYMTPDLQWLSTRPITDAVRYTATSYPDFRYGPAQITPALSAFTALPSGFNPRTVAWAGQLRTDTSKGSAPPTQAIQTQAIVDAALAHLRSGGYEYSLEPGVYGLHTADEFWFDRKLGFCEHIASAFVVLMRAAQVPARIVTGYQGGERNPLDSYWMVRQSDAHAWAEVWIEERGWVRIDPTGSVSPGRVGQFQRLQAPVGVFGNAVGAVISLNRVQQLRAVWDAINNSWNQRVLNYTQVRQLDLLKALGVESPSWQDLARILGGLVGCVAVAGVLWVLWERRQHDPWLRLLQQVRHRLQGQGLVVSDTASPRTLADAVLAAYGEAARPLHNQLLALERLRYAPAQQDGPEALRRLGQQLWKQLRKLENNL